MREQIDPASEFGALKTSAEMKQMMIKEFGPDASLRCGLRDRALNAAADRATSIEKEQKRKRPKGNDAGNGKFAEDN
jgi:hypothetical protein